MFFDSLAAPELTGAVMSPTAKNDGGKPTCLPRWDGWLNVEDASCLSRWDRWLNAEDASCLSLWERWLSEAKKERVRAGRAKGL